jgi:imidazolonepropionase
MAKLAEADLIIKNASQLLTIRGFSKRLKTGKDMNNLNIVENGAIAIKNGRIAWIGKSKNVKNNISLRLKGQMIDAKNKLVMPGLIDPHTHLVFSGSRHEEYKMKIAGLSYTEIHSKNINSGIISTMKATRNASESELVCSALERIRLATQHGTTTIEIKSGYGLNRSNELKILRVIKELKKRSLIDIVSTFLGAHTIPPEYRNRRELYVDLVISMLPKIYKEDLAKYCDVFCDNLGFTIEETRKILEKARNVGFVLKMHAEQTSYLGSAKLAAQLGVISADHLDHISYEGIKKMAKRGVVGILLPGVTFHLMERQKQKFMECQVKRMIESELPIALATDYNPGSCNTLSMQMIMKLAAVFYKMSPEQIINAATINAAHAVGMADEVGSLEIGKKADIIISDVQEYGELVDKFGYNLVRTVIKNGQII